MYIYYNNLFWIFVVLMGYTFYNILSSTETGGKNKIDIYLSKKLEKNINSSMKYKFKMGNKMIFIHIHHWLYLLIIGVSLSFIEYFLYAKYFCFGGIIQGIVRYKDWYKVVYVQEIMTKINSKL